MRNRHDWKVEIDPGLNIYYIVSLSNKCPFRASQLLFQTLQQTLWHEIFHSFFSQFIGVGGGGSWRESNLTLQMIQVLQWT